MQASQATMIMQEYSPPTHGVSTTDGSQKACRLFTVVYQREINEKNLRLLQTTYLPGNYLDLEN